MQEFMLPTDTQKANEYKFNRKQLDDAIGKIINNTHSIVDKIDKGIELLKEWLAQDYYESKQLRLNQVKKLDLYRVVLEVFIGVSYCQSAELFVSITAQLASRLGFNNKRDGITTMAEIVAVLAHTDYYDIIRNNSSDSYVIICNYAMPAEIVNFNANCQYLPPMVSEPKEIRNNRQSGYYTFEQSVILRNDNHHEDPIALDVINTQNRVKLRLDIDFINSVEELPTYEITTNTQLIEWSAFLTKSIETYELINEQSGVFYETHRYDKRGRMYVNGYHISSMGTPYKKAMIDLAEEEFVDVPEEFQV